jgi:hypothetical protein
MTNAQDIVRRNEAQVAGVPWPYPSTESAESEGYSRGHRGTFELSDDERDVIRCAMLVSQRECVRYLNASESTSDYWVSELWDLDRAARALRLDGWD